MLIILRNILICYYIIFVTIPTSYANIYLLQFPQHGNNRLSSHEGKEDIGKAAAQKNTRLFIHKLVDLISKDNDKKTRNKCFRLFGSIYGTKNQRLRCLEKLKAVTHKKEKLKHLDEPQKRIHDRPLSVDPLNYDDIVYYGDDYPYLSLTPDIHRISTDYIDIDDFTRSEISKNRFSADYIDIDDLRSLKKVLSRRHKPKPQIIYVRNLRKANIKTDVKTKTDTKTRANTKRASSSDESDEVIVSYNKGDDSSDSDRKEDSEEDSDRKNEDSSDNDRKNKESDETAHKKVILSKIKTLPQVKKNKRFKIVNKIKSDSESDEAKDETTSIEFQKPFIQQSSFESEEKPSRPVRKKKQKSGKSGIYLQGNRYISLSSEEAERRTLTLRLPYFLPKRFIWDKDDIQHLGYYWFNGPQGKHSFFRLRP